MVMHPHLHLHPAIQRFIPLGFPGNNSQQFSYLRNCSQTTTLLPHCLSQLAEIMEEAAGETLKC